MPRATSGRARFDRRDDLAFRLLDFEYYLRVFKFQTSEARFRDRRDPVWPERDRGWEAMQNCYPVAAVPVGLRNPFVFEGVAHPAATARNRESTRVG